MTELQAEAIDLVHFTAAKQALVFKQRRGDMILINNFAVFHGRNGFEDVGTEKRHILRLWLRNEEKAWSIPDCLRRSWEEIYGPHCIDEPFDVASKRLTREQMVSRGKTCS